MAPQLPPSYAYDLHFSQSHQYTYEKEVTVESDHKPLEAIMIVSSSTTSTKNVPTVAAVHIHTDIQVRQGDDPS